MKKSVLRLLALMLVALVLLTGCSRYPHFNELEYERPDVVELEQTLEKTVLILNLWGSYGGKNSLCRLCPIL